MLAETRLAYPSFNRIAFRTPCLNKNTFSMHRTLRGIRGWWVGRGGGGCCLWGFVRGCVCVLVRVRASRGGAPGLGDARVKCASVIRVIHRIVTCYGDGFPNS
jgi:hypothetical protein